MRLLIFTIISLTFPILAQGQTGNVTLSRPDLSGEIPADTTGVTGVDLGDESLYDLSYLYGRKNDLPVNRSLTPRVFSGYRNIQRPKRYTVFPDKVLLSKSWEEAYLAKEEEEREEEEGEREFLDTIAERTGPQWFDVMTDTPDREDLPVAFGSSTPEWLGKSLDRARLEEDFAYRMMIENPSYIDYAYWDLPVPPRLPEEDLSLTGYLKRLDLPTITTPTTVEVQSDGERINWLHTFNIALQLSQAYVSPNWYQGGSSYLAFLGNLLWDVQLNEVYYPNVIFQSTVSYKLAVNSTPDDEYHAYNISQDLFQYNLKFGYKAAKHWYYSFLTTFKTQFFNGYPTDSQERSASFLSPGELNLGLGMTYTKENEKKNLKFSASISPASYNLKTCIDSHIDHTTFGIEQDRKYLNEFGSNAEINFYAQVWDNTTYTTRLFMFSDYSNFLMDWENTINFQFTKVFSTQIYCHLRWDTSIESTSARWKKFMLKEILSVGISYTFSTK